MFRLTPLAFLIAVSLGCGDGKPSGSGAAKPGGAPDVHDHTDHDRGKLSLADFGPHHAALTAHISKDENNLEILFETQDKDPKPVSLPLSKFTATVKRAGDDKSYELTFEPAPKEERKTDKDGECSHFEAKAPWMKPDDTLAVTAMIDLAGKPRKVEWKDFSPKKYSHADEKK